MGIRYHAYPLPTDDIEKVRADWRCYLASDEFDDFLDQEDAVGTLDLDKSWHELQQLFGARDQTPRPAFNLVKGNVTNTSRGWKPSPWSPRVRWCDGR